MLALNLRSKEELTQHWLPYFYWVEVIFPIWPPSRTLFILVYDNKVCIRILTYSTLAHKLRSKEELTKHWLVGRISPAALLLLDWSCLSNLPPGQVPRVTSYSPRWVPRDKKATTLLIRQNREPFSNGDESPSLQSVSCVEILETLLNYNYLFVWSGDTSYY